MGAMRATTTSKQSHPEDLFNSNFSIVVE